MSYDEADGYVLLFGGVTMNSWLGDTWKYSHGVWTQLHPALSPSPRQASGMAYDQADGYVVLFGGTGRSGTDLGDTWTYHGGSWSEVSTSTGPFGRYHPAMTYDAADGYILLYGGENSSFGGLTDTWAYSGGVWWTPNGASGPGPYYADEMAYDSEDGYVVLFQGGEGDNYASTWTYLAGVWTNITFALGTSPPSVGYGGMVDDTYDGYLLLYGGLGPAGQSNQTWGFENGAWAELFPSTNPGWSFTMGMAFDPPDDSVVLFSGDSSAGIVADTWTYLRRTGRRDRSEQGVRSVGPESGPGDAGTHRRSGTPAGGGRPSPGELPERGDPRSRPRPSKKGHRPRAPSEIDRFRANAVPGSARGCVRAMDGVERQTVETEQGDEPRVVPDPIEVDPSIPEPEYPLALSIVLFQEIQRPAPFSQRAV